MEDSNQQRWQRLLLLHEGTVRSSKGDRRAMQILDKATTLIAQEGYEALSFETLSKKCKITRPLIHHYFADKEQLLLAVIQYVGIEHQSFILSHIGKTKNPLKVLQSYILGNLSWPSGRKEHSRVWMHYLALAGYNPRDKTENTKSVEHGLNRIRDILEQGAQEKFWNDVELRSKARTIQIMITGAVISLITEHRDQNEFRQMLQMIQSETARILGITLE